MRILFISSASSTHTVKWVNSLAERNHEVILVTPERQSAETAYIDDRVKIEYLKYNGYLGYYLNAFRLRKISWHYMPDIINAHFASGNGTMARIAKLHPLIISCWGSDIYDFPQKSLLSKRILEKNLTYADAVASTSFAMLIQAEKYIQDPEKILRVTPFGVDTDRFLPAAGNRDGIIRIGIIKYLEAVYDISLLIRSFYLLLKKTDKNIKLLIYGEGTEEKMLKDLVKSLKIEAFTEFWPNVPNDKVPEILSAFDIFVNSSKKESFGVSVIEAMSCALPVVVTDTEGPGEIIKNGTDGIIVKDRNPESMANALLKLVETPELRKEYGTAARKKIVSEYGLKRSVDIMEKLYMEVIRRKE